VRRWRVVVAAGPELGRAGARYLRDQPGFEVVCVTAGAERALAATATLDAQLLLLDLDLAHAGGGLPLLRRLRAGDSPVEVIAMTASTDAEVVQATLRLGAVDYLVKPFELERLRRALGAVRRRMATAVPGRRLTQEQIDELTRGPAERWLPRDLEPRRLEQVRAALRLHGGAVTADAIARAVGVARTTARRYLEYLVTVGEATVDQLPGGPGRPPKAYSARTRQPAGGALAC
jgi:response regulator of citrate/malate metabolism